MYELYWRNQPRLTMIRFTKRNSKSNLWILEITMNDWDICMLENFYLINELSSLCHVNRFFKKVNAKLRKLKMKLKYMYKMQQLNYWIICYEQRFYWYLHDFYWIKIYKWKMTQRSIKRTITKFAILESRIKDIHRKTS